GFAYRRDEVGAVDNLERLRRVMPHCRDVRRFGSAELDLCLVARGAYDAYWEFDLAPYDVAAGAIVVREAGGVVTDIDGGDDWLFGGRILASNGALHEPVRQYLP
ncbi:MAG: inositol monophosphatase family protein, partial [Planctomycetota bacterium]